MKRKKESYVKYIKNHKNSKGEKAPWVICQHDTDKILSSHKTKEEAESHLKDIYIHKGNKINTFRWFKDLDELLKQGS